MILCSQIGCTGNGGVSPIFQFSVPDHQKLGFQCHECGITWWKESSDQLSLSNHEITHCPIVDTCMRSDEDLFFDQSMPKIIDLEYVAWYNLLADGRMISRLRGVSGMHIAKTGILETFRHSMVKTEEIIRSSIFLDLWINNSSRENRHIGRYIIPFNSPDYISLETWDMVHERNSQIQIVDREGNLVLRPKWVL